MTKRPYRAHPRLRVVQDDRLKQPAIDRELQARELVRRGCQLAAGCAVLGLSYLAAVALVAIARWWR